MIKYLKNIFAKDNLLFIIGSIIAGIIILNLYSKLPSGAVYGWLSLVVVVASTVIGIMIVGWVLHLRRSSMHIFEWIITLLMIVAIMLSLNFYQPQILYGANTFLEPSRNFLVDTGRSLIAK